MGSEKKKVMVAIDESECSRYALQWTLDNLSQTIHISQLVLFTVQPISDFTYAYTSSFGAARMSLSLFLYVYINQLLLLLLLPTATCKGNAIDRRLLFYVWLLFLFYYSSGID